VIWGGRLKREDAAKPRFFIHGWHEPLDLTDPELQLWTDHAPHGCFFPSFYCFAHRLSNGTPFVHLTQHASEDRAAWVDEPSRRVAGYIYLLQVTDAAFYATGAAPPVYEMPRSSYIDFKQSDPAKRVMLARRQRYAMANAWAGCTMKDRRDVRPHSLVHQTTKTSV